MKLIAITSCAGGIAHTFMAAEAIRTICKEKGIECKVETQGAIGIEDKLTKNDIEEADLIVFGNDIKILELDRFDGYENKIISIKPHDIIKQPDLIFAEERK